jgi:hypothetical protein
VDPAYQGRSIEVTATDLATLTAAASKAQAALTAEREKQAAIVAAEAAERTARSIEWSYQTILAFPGDLAAASAEVAAATAAFDAAAVEGLGEAAYLRIASTMAVANGLGEGVTRAKNILRDAHLLPPGRRNSLDPVGMYAPFPRTGLPPFGELVESAIAAARSRAERMAAFTADPGSFTGKASEAMKRGVLANEYHGDEELELLLALKVKFPTHYAERLTPEQRAAVEVYAAARDASGHGDDPLPTPSIPTEWRHASAFPTAREEATRRGRMP